ncbi:astacin-like metalloendopeptidase [Lineus longissimus]|uniref:astacin-like metalloendopeptidase n=1 Tax=Lineus longissimus TaxID=88925 RepID=UPI00315C6CC3
MRSGFTNVWRFLYQWIGLVLVVAAVDGTPNRRSMIQRNVPLSLHKWPYAIVPYIFDESFDISLKEYVDEAMRYIERCSCVGFVKWTDQPNHVKFVSRHGCSSDVGMQYMKDSQAVSIAKSCATGKGVVVHELMHALGFVHEHQRPDRDEYIKILKSNINPDSRAQFRPRTDLKLLAAYDLDSIMQYPENFGAKKKGKPTITQLVDRDKYKIGQRDHLSEIDKYELNKLYCDTV